MTYPAPLFLFCAATMGLSLAACSNSADTQTAAPAATTSQQAADRTVEELTAKLACQDKLKDAVTNATSAYVKDYSLASSSLPTQLSGTATVRNSSESATVQFTCALTDTAPSKDSSRVSSSDLNVTIDYRIVQDSSDSAGGSGNTGKKSNGDVQVRDQDTNDLAADATIRGQAEVARGGAGNAPQADAITDADLLPTKWDFDYADKLENATGLFPGAVMHNLTAQGSCSVGHFAGSGNRRFIITAGHCGDKGDVWAYQDAQGQTIKFGETVESFFSEVQGTDIGLIELWDPANTAYSVMPGLSGTFRGFATLDEIKTARPTMCRVGFRTGFSCGRFLKPTREGIFLYANISNKGDSGGPIYAIGNDGYYAVGVSSYLDHAHPTVMGGMEIASIIKKYNLTFYIGD